jgi:hypothetical protein
MQGFWNWLNNIFGARPDTSPAPITNYSSQSSQVYHSPDAITRFRAEIAIGSPTFSAAIGSLKGKITDHEFYEYCLHFSRGVEYIYQHFGTIPAKIQLSDEDAYAPRYNYGDQTIYLPRNMIESQVKACLSRQSKTEPFLLNPNQMAFAYAVEEAFHAYQFTNNPKKYDQLHQKDLAKNLNNSSKTYDDDSEIEGEARAVVRQALIDTKVIDWAPTAWKNIRPQDTEWVKSLLSDRCLADSSSPAYIKQ